MKSKEQVVELALAELHPFPNHPLKVRVDDAMHETVECIKSYMGYSQNVPLSEHGAYTP